MSKHRKLLLVMAFVCGCAATYGLGRGGPLQANAQQEDGSAEAGAKDERVFMLNALWFKPDGGAEKYREYMQAAGPFVAKHGASSPGAYVPEAALIGEFDADLVFFVEWPNEAAFLKLIADPGYQAISHLREEAIKDSLLIRCRPLVP